MENHVPALVVIAQDLAKTTSILIRVFKGRVLSLLELLQVVATLKDMDFTKVKQELLLLDDAAKAELKAAFDAGLSIDDPMLLKKITDTVDVLDQMIDVVEESVTVVTKAMALLARLRMILGVA